MNYMLTAEARTVKGAKVRAQSKNVPAVVYGAGKDAESLSISAIEFLKLYKQAGESSLIDLTVAGKDGGKVLIQDVQFDPVSDQVIHVDFRRIDMNKAMTAPVDLHFIGIAPIVKAMGGTLVTNIESVEVECLPKDLVSFLEIDLSVLNSFDDIIKVKDIKLPPGVVISSPNADDLVAKATPALSEEELKAMEAVVQPTDLSKIELSGKKKEEAVEGEAAAAAPEAKKDVKKEVKK